MKEFEDLKQLWNKQERGAKLGFDAIMKRIVQAKGELARKMLVQAITFLVAFALLIYVWTSVTFVTWTSHLAMLLVMCCIVVALLRQWKSYKEIRDASALLFEPRKYITHLKRFQANRNRTHTRIFTIYESCLAAAFALYSFELYFALPFALFIGFVLFILVWFLLAHFVVMKAYIKYENARIQQMVEDLERIQDQFEKD